MDDESPSTEPTATSLKKELRESLAILKANFESLDKFVAELTSEGTSAPISLTKSDIDDLISVSLELQDAANNLEFEARKIHDKLSSIIV
jgi:hypothetical protein